MTSIEQSVCTPQNMARIASDMERQYAAIVSQSKDRQKQLSIQKAALEKRMSGLYDIMELNGVDKFNLDRLNAIKAQIVDIENEMASCRADENVPMLTAEQIEATLQAMHEKLSSSDEQACRFLVNLFVKKIVVGQKNISMQLSMENILDSMGNTVYERLVPRTRVLHLAKIICKISSAQLLLSS